MKLLALVTVLVVLVGPAFACTKLAAVYRAEGSRTNCSLIHVDYHTGMKTYVAPDLAACKDLNPAVSARPQTALSGDGSSVLYFSGSGKYVHSIDIATGGEQEVVAAPAKHSLVFGMEVVGSDILLGTTQALLRVPMNGGAVTSVANLTLLQLGELSQMATDGSTTAWITGQDGSFTSIDLRTGAAITQSSSLGAVLDLQYDSVASVLYALANYELYTVVMAAGSTAANTTGVLRIPDGDGFPFVSALSSQLFWFADFQNLYSVSLKTPSAPAIDTRTPFDGYFCSGNFVPFQSSHACP